MESNKFTITRGDKTITIEEITKEESIEKKRLGAAGGTDLGQCVYLGMRYGSNFFERVKYYRPCSKEEFYSKATPSYKTEDHPIFIEFYE